MKVYEILSLAPELLKTLHESGIKNDDYKWLDLFRDFTKMIQNGDKMVYIVAILSERYNICERKVYKIIKRMKRECRTGAVG